MTSVLKLSSFDSVLCVVIFHIEHMVMILKYGRLFHSVSALCLFVYFVVYVANRLDFHYLFLTFQELRLHQGPLEVRYLFIYFFF